MNAEQRQQWLRDRERAEDQKGLRAMVAAVGAGNKDYKKQKDAWDVEDRMADDFRKETSKEQGVLAAHRTMQAVAAQRKPDGRLDGPSNMALVYSFMKALDPTSTVRESEKASADNAAGVDVRVRNIWNNLKDGGSLDPGQIDEFLAVAARQAEVANNTLDNVARRYHETAGRRDGINTLSVTPGYAPTKPPAAPPERRNGDIRGDEGIEVACLVREARAPDETRDQSPQLLTGKNLERQVARRGGGAGLIVNASQQFAQGPRRRERKRPPSLKVIAPPRVEDLGFSEQRVATPG
jgi:hypothetical protein